MAICGAGTSADCDKISQNVRLRLKLVMQQVCDGRMDIYVGLIQDGWFHMVLLLLLPRFLCGNVE